MKRTLLAIVAAFVMITSANAQRLTDIQAEARFITDKMIVELGLSNVQRNSLLNINLNYLDGIRSYRDIDAYGWHYRNKQLKRMLNARQWKRFKEAYYFYHPIGWNNNTYIYNIYNKYPKHHYRPSHPHPHYYGKPYKYDKKWKHDKKRYEKEYKHNKKRYEKEYKYDKKRYEKEYKHDKKHYDKHYKPGRREFDNNPRKSKTWREKVRRDIMGGAR